ncbi:type VI secretion system amidase immunity protein Tai4 [Aquabacterium sp. A7-Y]|uniref:type VI secretion system amidase immunity protein Tai4 n=1 Tax=Aquabacterium sp. A7-Y TaxID=1349605 RepID=UPI00223E3952|nr:type VI secretion system amidase immunity protein Tai4 [Aquabacterium sp. A7-Y]MCW7537990.1 type VI secretion system amidase immunity protein Tai4 [Aquabacterium sp. A7-Y]
MIHRWLISALLLAASLCVQAKDQPGTSPQAAERTYGQNFKDIVLATCIATAYRKEPNAAADAGSSVSALRDWTYYDMENSPDAIKSLVDAYLARDYHNPLVAPEVKDVKFDLLKCLDLYHSKELAAQAKRFVQKPNRTYRQDHPPRR